MKASQSTVAGGSNSSAPLGRSGLGASTGQRLPVPPRERKPALAALAVLLILGGALTSAYLVIASGQRVSAIVIGAPVAAGQPIPANALREAQIGDTGINFVNWSEHTKVAGSRAAVSLVPGTLLTNDMVTPAGAAAAEGRVVVGLALKPGQLPAADLHSGKRVSVYAVGGTEGGPRAGTLLSADALVVTVASGGDERLRGDQTMVDVAVPPADAPLLTQAASAGAVAIVLVPPGTTVPTGRPVAPADLGGGQNGQNGQNGRRTPGPGGGTVPSGGTGGGQTNDPAGG
ncbi:hypothetical protein [Thermomonospora umbrina]|uniref:SAF domain-containing protein n=1 Tax=Thermomonospora umbrina TaxID=111806 RepID=A0A3D9SQU3_9ACTN|nr:hypothetical protein [Thermomonospora umbrina]REE98309.1 hypothetical protein DFJ69_3795 [Thermomonospora umbrina]